MTRTFTPAQRDRQNENWRKWYERNRAKKIAWQNRRRVEIRAWVEGYKASHPCVRCGEADPTCLVFHHREPETKSFEVANVVRLNFSLRKIELEIAKCDVLCANCHAKLHADEIGA